MEQQLDIEDVLNIKYFAMNADVLFRLEEMIPYIIRTKKQSKTQSKHGTGGLTMAEKEYIERGAFAERLQDFSEWCRDGRKQGVDFVLDCPLPNMPAADVVEVKHAEWIYHECVSSYESAKSGYSCSACGAFINEEVFETDEIYKNFCSGCGAKMDGERKEQQ